MTLLNLRTTSLESFRFDFPKVVKNINTLLPSLGLGERIIRFFSSMLFSNLERLVASIPNFFPREVEAVPSASMFSSTKPVAIVELYLLASLLYILLTEFHVDRNAASIVSFLIYSYILIFQI